MADPNSSQRVARFGVFEFDREAGELRKHGLKVKLHGQPVQVLELLLQRPGRVMTREELRAKLWPGDTFVDFEHGLNAAIQRLREALGDSADTPRYVETLPRRGYRFIAPVEGLGAPGAATTPRQVPGGSALLGWRLAGLGIAVVALGAVLVGLNVGGLRERLLGRPAPGIGPGGRPVIAVMYFDYSGGAEETRWLSRGVPNMLVTALAQTPGLDVVSSQRLHEVLQGIGSGELESIDKGRVLEVARRAGAGAVMVGSIFQVGSEFRIDVQVENVESGRVLFAHNVRGRDVFQLVDELSGLVRSGLNLAMAPPDRSIAEVTTGSLEAYRLYTEGLEALRNVRYADARQFLQKAVELDPSFAMPYFQLSRIAGRVREPALEKEYLLKTMEHLDRLPERHKLLVQAILARKVEQNPVKAINLLEDLLARYPDEEEAYALLYRTYARDLNQLQKVLATAERGVKALPNSSFLRNDYGYALLGVGRYAEAVPQFEAYARVRPNEANPHDSLGEAYLFTGQPEKALESYARALELDPSFWGSHQGRAGAYAMLGRYDAALSELDEAGKILVQADLPLTGNHRVKAHLLSRVGRYREAEEHLRQGLQSAESHKDSLFKTLVHLLAGRLALERRDYRGAGDSARRAREAAQQMPSGGRRDELSLVADLLAGTAEARAGNLKAARAHLESIMKLQNPELELHRQYYHWLEGEIALAAGNLIAAEKAYSVAVPQIKPFWLNICASSALHRDGLARVKRARGDLRGAIAAYRDLLTPDIASKWIGMLEPRYVLELARLLAKTGDREAARKEYRRFLNLWKDADPEFPTLRQARSEYAKLK